MADKLSVSADRMKADYDAMKDKVDNLVVNSNEILDIVNRLSQVYSGPAYETFKDTMNNGIEQLQALLKFWESYLNTFQEADKTYKDTERKVYDFVHGIKL